MITVGYIQRMAGYNRWQNENLYGAADRLSDVERRLDRGAFFGSIHATLNHLLWGDRMWMSRFAGTPKPEGGIPQSVSLFDAWEVLKRERIATDATIVDWADRLAPAWTERGLTWFSAAANREITVPKWNLVMHFFNHQTHHRGQVHCMLTAAGAKPGDTDLFLMPVTPIP
jgi:uncharacterized damage-inducible protein DinB